MLGVLAPDSQPCEELLDVLVRASHATGVVVFLRWMQETLRWMQEALRWTLHLRDVLVGASLAAGVVVNQIDSLEVKPQLVNVHARQLRHPPLRQALEVLHKRNARP